MILRVDPSRPKKPKVYVSTFSFDFIDKKARKDFFYSVAGIPNSNRNGSKKRSVPVWFAGSRLPTNKKGHVIYVIPDRLIKETNGGILSTLPLLRHNDTVTLYKEDLREDQIPDVQKFLKLSRDIVWNLLGFHHWGNTYKGNSNFHNEVKKMYKIVSNYVPSSQKRPAPTQSTHRQVKQKTHNNNNTPVVNQYGPVVRLFDTMRPGPNGQNSRPSTLLVPKGTHIIEYTRLEEKKPVVRYGMGKGDMRKTYTISTPGSTKTFIPYAQGKERMNPTLNGANVYLYETAKSTTLVNSNNSNRGIRRVSSNSAQSQRQNSTSSFNLSKSYS
jgi:hypothetical protein